MVELQQIFKYPLKITDKQFIEVPMYGRPLKLAYQGKDLYMWWQVTPSRDTMSIPIYIFGTGGKMPYIPLNYIDTVFDRGLVWHVYMGID